MASSRNSSTQRIDIAKSSIDLTASLLNATNSSSPLVNAAIETGQWLTRERLDRFELAGCLSKAQGVAYPNQIGREFCAKVRKDTVENPIPYIFLVQSGSLGRIMVRDTWLCWIVSTVTSLYQFYGSEDGITNILCDFILRQKDTREAALPRGEFSSRGWPERMQIEPVVKKIVSSIWLNVVNAGHQVIGLPEELSQICPFGHCLTSEKLGSAMNTIQNGGRRMIVCSKRFFADITLWLMLHLDGVLRVVVSGRIVYEKRLGPAGRDIEIRVSQFCSSAGDCCAREGGDETWDNVGWNRQKDSSHESFNPPFEILEEVDDQDFRRCYRAQTIDYKQQPDPTIRQALYDLPKFQADNRTNTPSIQSLIRSTARRIVRWLLKIPLETEERTRTSLSFRAFGGKETPNRLAVSSLLGRVPAIVNFHWGDDKEAFVVYEPLAHDDGDELDWETDKYGMTLDEEKELIWHLPILKDLLFKIKRTCQCPWCLSDEHRAETKKYLPAGCLRSVALNDVLILIGHSIADGFGCDDVSGIKGSKRMLVQSSLDLMLDICKFKTVAWNTWFYTAACFYLGCPYNYADEEMGQSLQGKTCAAVQYGNLSVLAPWLNLKAKLELQHCFTLIYQTGTINVSRRVKSQEDTFHLQGMNQTFAVVQTQETDLTTSHTFSSPERTLIFEGDNLVLENDQSDTECELLLVSTQQHAYRMLFKVRSEHHSRIINPADAMLQLGRCHLLDSCSHTSRIGSKQTNVLQDSFIYPFDGALGHWVADEGNPEDDGDLFLTLNLDSHLKLNVMMALTLGHICVINNGSSCLSCAQTKVRAIMRRFSEEMSENRYSGRLAIINIQRELGRLSGQGSHRHQLMEQPSSAMEDCIPASRSPVSAKFVTEGSDR